MMTITTYNTAHHVHATNKYNCIRHIHDTAHHVTNKVLTWFIICKKVVCDKYKCFVRL